MDRRDFCVSLALGPFLAVNAAFAQPARTARVAWASMERADPASPFFVSFRRGLRDQGWTEGRNLALEPWWAEGSGERMRKLIPEIVASRPDVIVTAGGASSRLLVDAGVPVPLVFTFSGDVVIGKIAESYARPGGNRTGISFFSLELVPKRLELLRDSIPGLKRVAIVGSPHHAGERMEVQAAADGAAKLGLDHQYYPVASEADLVAAYDRAAQSRAQALLAFADAIMTAHAGRFAELSQRHRVPALSSWAVFAEKGNLMTYGPSLEECYVRLAHFVDRILKGAKAGEIPVEQPSRIEMVINMRAARALGVTLPQSVLARADRIIE